MVLGFWIISWPPFTEQVGRNQGQVPTKGSVCPEQCPSLVDPFLPKCLEKQPVAHVYRDLVGWPSWRCQTLFFYLQRIVPQEALEPHLPLLHQRGWGSVNPTSVSFLRKVDLGDILPTSSAGTQRQAHTLLFPTCSQTCFPDQARLVYIFHLEDSVPCQCAWRSHSL